MSIDAKTPNKISAKLPTLPDDLSSVYSTHMVEDNQFLQPPRLFFNLHKYTMATLHRQATCIHNK